MTAYVDASVVLRLALGQPNALAEWSKIQRGRVERARDDREHANTRSVAVARAVVGTSDAIHLATALLWRDMTRAQITMATHDAALGLSAKAHGLSVVGLVESS